MIPKSALVMYGNLELSYDKEIKDKMMCTLFDSGLQNLGTSL
jgi:hypothetical protein